MPDFRASARATGSRPAAGSGRSVQPCNGESSTPVEFARNIRVQNARQEQALASYEKTVLTSFEDVENALVAYAKEQTRNVSLEEAVKRSRNSLQISSQRYANGLTNFIDVLDAERSLYQAQDNLVQSDQAVSQDLIALYKALGGGWEESKPASDPSKIAAATEGGE